MEINETDDKDGHIYRLKKIDKIQEILIAERDKRNELSTKYMLKVAAPTVIGMEAVAIVMGLHRVVGN